MWGALYDTLVPEEDGFDASYRKPASGVLCTEGMGGEPMYRTERYGSHHYDNHRRFLEIEGAVAAGGFSPYGELVEYGASMDMPE